MLARLVFAALSIAVVSCGDANAPSRSPCGIGRGGVAGLPPPTPVWTRASAQSIFYAPRVADLDDDGVLEVLLAGGNETPAFGEVMALNAKTGTARWHTTADAELYSSPVVLDVTGDGVKAVFVGGRMAAFIAVDGASGDVLWRFEDDRTPDDYSYSFYNFYTPVLIS